MILRRLFKIVPVSRTTYEPKPIAFYFSNEEQNVEADEALVADQGEVAAQAPEQQIKAEDAGAERGNEYGWQEEDDEEDYQRDSYVVDEFLLEPSIGRKARLALKNKQAMKPDAMEKLQNQINESLQSRLNAYVKSLDIEVADLSLMARTEKQAETAYNQQAITKSILQQDVKNLTRLYINNHFTSMKREYYGFVLENVLKFPRIGFALNTLYDCLPMLREDSIGKYNTELITIVKKASVELYEDANLLKLYWVAANLLEPQTSPADNQKSQKWQKKQPSSVEKEVNDRKEGELVFKFLRRELLNLKVSNVDLKKELRDLNYFFLNEKSSILIIKQLTELCQGSLQKFVQLWFLTMTILSKVHQGIEENAINSINITNALKTADKKGEFQFFNTKLTSILGLTNENISQSYRIIFQNSILSAQENKSDTLLLSGSIERKLGRRVNQTTQMPITYTFEKDPKGITITLTSNSNKNPSSIETSYQSIIAKTTQGNYEPLLEYYVEFLGPKFDCNQLVMKYTMEARHKGYRSKNIQALYVLKELHKESRKWFADEDFRLSTNIMIEFQNEYLERICSQEEYQQFLKMKGKYPEFDEDLQQHMQDQKTQSTKFRQKFGKSVFGQVRREPKAGYKKQDQPAKRGLFSQQRKEFSTQKNNKEFDQDYIEPIELDDQYEKYLKTVKQIDEESKKPIAVNKELEFIAQPEHKIFSFAKCITVEDFSKQFAANMHKINENNIQGVLRTYDRLPEVEKVANLVKHFFLNVKVDSRSPSGLVVQFQSSSGAIEKNYGVYLEGCGFNFKLPERMYVQMLRQQSNRYKFKRIISHIALHHKEISNELISSICQICTKDKIGFTLIEFGNLLFNRKVHLSLEGLRKIANTIQHFGNMQADLIQFVKKFCDKEGFTLSANFFEPYIRSLNNSEKYEILNDFITVLQDQIKPREYKIDKALSVEQNIEQDRIYREKQTARVNIELFQILKFIAESFKARTEIPPFIPALFDVYIAKKKGPMSSSDYSAGLLIYSQKQEKIQELLEKIKNDPVQNNEQVFSAAVNCLTLFGRSLRHMIDKILEATLYKKHHVLNEVYLTSLGSIFKNIDTPAAYAEYLEYLLKKQPQTNETIRGLYYSILNSTSEESAKTKLINLLDFLFNPAREKERIQHKHIQEEEDKKKDILLKILEGDKKQEVKVEEVKADSAKQGKQKKKSKKEKKQKGAEEQADVNAEKKKAEEVEKKVKVEEQKKQVRNLDKKAMDQLKSLYNYDKYGKFTVTPKPSKKLLRNQNIRYFLDSFLIKKAPEEQDKKGGNKGLKTGKQKATETDKKGGKKQAGKKESGKK